MPNGTFVLPEMSRDVKMVSDVKAVGGVWERPLPRNISFLALKLVDPHRDVIL